MGPTIMGKRPVPAKKYHFYNSIQPYSMSTSKTTTRPPFCLMKKQGYRLVPGQAVLSGWHTVPAPAILRRNRIAVQA